MKSDTYTEAKAKAIKRSYSEKMYIAVDSEGGFYALDELSISGFMEGRSLYAYIIDGDVIFL